MTRPPTGRGRRCTATAVILCVAVGCGPASGAERQQYKWPPWFPNKMKPMFETKPRAGRDAAAKRVGKPIVRNVATPVESAVGGSGNGATAAGPEAVAATGAGSAAAASGDADAPTASGGGIATAPAAAVGVAEAAPELPRRPARVRLPRPRPVEAVEAAAAGDPDPPAPLTTVAAANPLDGPASRLEAGLASDGAAPRAERAPSEVVVAMVPVSPIPTAGAGWTDPRGNVGEVLAVPAESPFAALPMTASEGRLTTADREATGGEDTALSARQAAGETPDPDAGSASAAAAIDALARLPRARPGGATGPELAMATVGEPADLPSATDVPALAPAVPDGNEMACRARLDAMGVSYKPLPPLDPGGPCEVLQPLAVTAVGSGVRLTSTATLNCRTTAALATWVRDSVTPAARATLTATPTAIAPGSTYACRPRNNQAGAKLSEHGNANAVDVMSIAFAERQPVDVQAWPADSPEGRFQAMIRSASCKTFTTVLGPGDAAHSNHLHLDLAVRRGGYRLCSLDGGQRVAGRTFAPAGAPAGAKTNSE